MRLLLVLPPLTQNPQRGNQRAPGDAGVQRGEEGGQRGSAEDRDLLVLHLGHVVVARREQGHQPKQFVHRLRILRGVRSDVLERPLQVLVRCQVAGQHAALLTTDAQQAVVDGQHRSIVRHNFTVVVVGSGCEIKGLHLGI